MHSVVNEFGQRMCHANVVVKRLMKLTGAWKIDLVQSLRSKIPVDKFTEFVQSILVFASIVFTAFFLSFGVAPSGEDFMPTSVAVALI